MLLCRVVDTRVQRGRKGKAAGTAGTAGVGAAAAASARAEPRVGSARLMVIATEFGDVLEGAAVPDRLRDFADVATYGQPAPQGSLSAGKQRKAEARQAAKAARERQRALLGVAEWVDGEQLGILLACGGSRCSTAPARRRAVAPRSPSLPRQGGGARRVHWRRVSGVLSRAPPRLRAALRLLRHKLPHILPLAAAGRRAGR